MANTPLLVLTGKDTIAVDSMPMVNLGSGDVFVAEFPNDVSSVEIGKNGNIVAALNQQGQKCEVTIKCLRGSPEDIYLNSREQQWNVDPSNFVSYTGNFVKRLGDGTGATVGDNIIAAFGVPKKNPGMKENTSGDPAQAQVEHYITFGQAIRAII